MPTPGRLALSVLLLAACFRDTPPALGSTSGETGDVSSGTTGMDTTTASETDCTPTPWYLDADMDGHGDPNTMQLACDPPADHVEVGDDCDDNDEARAPGLNEVCDDRDNDCDLLVDEYSAQNSSCNDCVLTADATSSYAYCQFQRTYTDARGECKKRGGDLAVIHDALENQALTTQAFILKGTESKWFIGLDDLAVEGAFVWVDGSAVDFQGWGPLEPNNVDGAESCVVLYAGDGSWNDQACDLAVEFICESAL